MYHSFLEVLARIVKSILAKQRMGLYLKQIKLSFLCPGKFPRLPDEKVINNVVVRNNYNY